MKHFRKLIIIGASIALLPSWQTAHAQFGGFVDSGQTFGFGNTHIGLGDLDGDGDPDAFVTARNDLGPSTTGENTVWLNDGSGAFVDSGQRLGTENSNGVALGDLDGDGDFDAFVTNNHPSGGMGSPNRVWLNDGNGNFTDSGQRLGTFESNRVQLRDFDGDTDLDALVGVISASPPNPFILWVNDGAGNFSIAPQTGTNDVRAHDAGDLDGDGDIDAFAVAIGIGGSPNSVWLNDGSGNLSATAQNLGNSGSGGVSLGDVDWDGDLDAMVANASNIPNVPQPNRLWLNDGSGTFTDSGQSVGNSRSTDVALGDLDFDGDLDAFVTNNAEPNTVWLNDGTGVFTDSGEALGNLGSVTVTLGDADGDGALDAFVANGLAANHPGKLWLNQSTPADSDGDGVPDIVDACPDSILSETVVIGDCDSGVENILFNDGCTLADLVQLSADGAKNHGVFVSRVSRLANGLKKAGVLTGKETGKLKSCAAQSKP